jgi:hypothetical protein
VIPPNSTETRQRPAKMTDSMKRVTMRTKGKQGGSMHYVLAKLKIKTLAATATAFLLTTAPVLAGQYELVKGKGVEVCEVYQKNLNASNPKQPMLCEREINPHFAELSKPEWKDVDIENNKRMLWSAFIVFHPKVARYIETPISEQDAERAVERSINLRSQTLKKTQIDIDNDGKLEEVLRYQDGICGIAQFAYSTSLLVLQDGKPDVDREKSDLLQQNTWRDPKTGETMRAIAEYVFNMYDVFFYKNTTYFDKADARPEERKKLYVYRIAQNRTQAICEYRFVNGK